MIIFDSLMMVDNTEKKTKRKKAVATVTKHTEKYLTTQFQKQAMNVDYTD